MRVITTALAALAFVATAFADKASNIEMEDGVYIIGDDNFESFIAENKFVLAEFYAPWCGHCKALVPEYAKAAAQLKESGSEVKLAKIDCTVHTVVAGAQEISGYPTLKFFSNGVAIPYQGGRQAAEIVNWLNKKTGPAATPITTKAELELIQENSEVVIIGAFEAEDSVEAKEFIKAAETFMDTTFVITTAAEIKEEYKVEKNGVVLIKDFDENKNIFEGEYVSDEIVAFVKANYLPVIMEFNPQNQAKIFGGEIKSHLLLFYNEDTLEPIRKCYTEVAKKYKSKVLFLIVDQTSPDAANVVSFFKIGPKDPLPVRLINMGGDLLKYAPEGETSCEQIDAFVNDYIEGKLEPYLMTEDVPEDWDAEPVKVLVGKNFHEVAFNKSQITFVEFYAPWCGHCKSLIPIWEKVGEHFESESGVVIAKMDSTANEVKEVTISSFPTLKLFKNGEAIDYAGDREFDALVGFVKTHMDKKAGTSDDEKEEVAKDAKEEVKDEVLENVEEIVHEEL